MIGGRRRRTRIAAVQHTSVSPSTRASGRLSRSSTSTVLIGATGRLALRCSPVTGIGLRVADDFGRRAFGRRARASLARSVFVRGATGDPAPSSEMCESERGLTCGSTSRARTERIGAGADGIARRARSPSRSRGSTATRSNEVSAGAVDACSATGIGITGASLADRSTGSGSTRGSATAGAGAGAETCDSTASGSAGVGVGSGTGCGSGSVTAGWAVGGETDAATGAAPVAGGRSTAGADVGT